MVRGLDLALICPACRNTLTIEGMRASCTSCQRVCSQGDGIWRLLLPDRAGEPDRRNRPVKVQGKGNGFFKINIHVQRIRGEGNLLQAARNCLQPGAAPDRAGADTDDLVDPEPGPDPVQGIVGIVDKERPSPDIRVPEGSDKE